ncbi:MAG: DUF368 domain-containing protein [Candidatus Woesearchaeota archaeon]
MNKIKLLLKGALMGICDIIPGISGASIALITGIYQDLINNIKKTLSVRSFVEFKKIPFSFFLPLGVGIITAIVIGANIVGYLLDFQRANTYALFLGLILISSILIFKEVKQKKYWYSIIGLIFGLLLGVLNAQINAQNPLITIFLGMIVILAMILPGISGSYVLLILGKYEFMIDVLRSADFFNIALFILGGLITLILAVKTIKKLLDKKKNETISFFCGLMIGALTTIINEIVFNASSILFILIGGLFAFAIWKIK